jgi:hypothetical protein
MLCSANVEQQNVDHKPSGKSPVRCSIGGMADFLCNLCVVFKTFFPTALQPTLSLVLFIEVS